ncbi:MAG: hypothetical protein R3A47_07435 [Polyangiales bacterium]
MSAVPEHAVLHLLYARFGIVLFYDEGIVPVPGSRSKSSFIKGMILGENNQRAEVNHAAT